MKRSRGPRGPPCQEGVNSGFPRLPKVTEPFSIFPSGSRRTSVRNVPWPSSLPRRQSGHLSPLPAISAQPALVNPWVGGRLLLEPKQVAVKFSPEDDPNLVWVRPTGRLPVTFFTGARAERPSKHIINHPAGKNKGAGRYFEKYFYGSEIGKPALGHFLSAPLIYSPGGLIFCNERRGDATADSAHPIKIGRRLTPFSRPKFEGEAS
jgi:hypothetical protein